VELHHHSQPGQRPAANYTQVVLTRALIAQCAGVSDATVIRAARSLGYSGLPELRRSLAVALTNWRPSTVLHERVASAGPEPLGVLDRVFEAAAELLEETHRTLDPLAFDTAVALLENARECLSFGIGISQTVAEYLALRLTRAGVPSRCAPLTGFGLADSLLPLTKNDVVVIFAPARLLREIDVVIDHAKSVDASVVLVTDALAPILGPRVEATLMAVLSPGGTLGETMVPTMLVDALLLAIIARNEARAVRTSETLSNLRAAIID